MCRCRGSHPLHRGCGLKCEGMDNLKPDNGHPLHRGCGLKSVVLVSSSILKSCHPLHRGCGLKYAISLQTKIKSCHPLHRGCGLKYDNPELIGGDVNVTLFTEGVD